MTNRIDPTLLRKSIYQSAIFGQLVAQNPEDGDASILLKEAERQKSLDIKSGIYKEKSFGKTAINEADFEDMPELPAGWIHCYLGQLIHLTSGVDLDSDSYSPENIGIPYITGASNFQSGVLLINRFTKAENQNSFHGEILLTCKGTIGEIAINTIGACHVARQVMAIKPYISDEFLIVLLKANVAKLSSQAKSLIPGISRDNILNLPIALPPLKEQQRIVEKIKLLEPLMAEYEALRERE
jgi:type I restriction enzyme S subunit